MNDFNELFENKLFWFVLFVSVFMLGLLGVKGYLVNNVADKVIIKLQKEYSPGPYAPGFNPDLVDPQIFRKK
jgi:hypothetical protein